MLRINFVTCQFCNKNFEIIDFLLSLYKKNQTGNGKPRKFSLIRLPFAHYENRSLSIVYDEETKEVIHLQTD